MNINIKYFGVLAEKTACEEEQIDLQPEILLTFGGMIVSKKIKTIIGKIILTSNK